MAEVTYCTRGDRSAEGMPKWRMEGEYILAYHYPFCCSGVVLANLGGSSNQFGRQVRTAAEIKVGVESWLEWFTQGEGVEKKKQFISVCTTDEQVAANAVLEELGFTRSDWVENLKYKGTKLCTWMLAIGHLNEGEG